MSSRATFNARTYSRKSVTKRKQTVETTPPKKRRKISEERESIDTEDDVGVPSYSLCASPERPKALPRVAKDLSDIFESVTPTSSPLSSPTKLAKRMLARSKTDSSIDSPSSVRIDRTPSMPNLPSSSPSKEPTFASFDPCLPPVPAVTNTRTYAGRSRSFLVAIPASSIDPEFSSVQEEDEYTARESYESLRSRWGVDNSEDDPYPLITTASPSPSTSTTPRRSPIKNGKGKIRTHQDISLRPAPLPPGMMNPLKSITELRSKGESRRFIDEVGYLFEGMDPNGGIGLKRASALEITTKLCDIHFARKAKAADFLDKTWDVFIGAGAGRGEDKILDAILAFFASLVSRDPTSLADLAQRSLDSSGAQRNGDASLVDTLFSLLSSQEDPLALVAAASAKDKIANDAELKEMRVGKKEKALLLTIHDTVVSRTSLFSLGTPISTTLLLIRSLQSLPPGMIPKNHFLALLSSLQKSLSAIIPVASTSSTYLNWPDAAQNVSFQCVYYHLRLLDMYLLRQWGSIIIRNKDGADIEDKEKGILKRKNERALQKARDEWLTSALITVGVCAELRGGPWALTCTELALRVLVSLTHADEVWARKVLECEPALGFVLRLILSSNDGRDVGNGGEKGQGKGTVKRELDNDDRRCSDEEEMDHGDSSAHALDRLCLALALLTNLVQAVDDMKEILRQTRLNPSCSLKQRGCIRRCVCSQHVSISALDVLLRLYNYQLMAPTSDGKDEPIKVEANTPPPRSAPEVESADMLFLRGHLAVLFGLLMRNSAENKSYILNALRGSAGDRSTLENLAEQARELSAFYDVLNTGGHGEGESEQRVANDVVLFLEGMTVATSSA